MNIYTIIVTYNGLKNNYVKNGIDSLLKSSVFTNIIIVDNNSSDGTVNYIQTEYPDIILIENDQNLGFGKANNIGITKALELGAEYVFLLNQDTIIKNNTIKKLYKASEKHPQFGILSPIHLYYDGKELEFYFAYFMNIRDTPSFYFDHIMNEQKKIYETSFVNAAAWFIPKKTLEMIGGFDPIFEHYGEDDNFCQRVHFHGLKIGIVSNSYILHDSKERKGSDSIFDKVAKYLRELQAKYANINLKFENAYKHERNTLIYNVFINTLIINKRQLRINWRKLQKLKNTFKQIEESRIINSEKGAHYL